MEVDTVSEEKKSRTLAYTLILRQETKYEFESFRDFYQKQTNEVISQDGFIKILLGTFSQKYPNIAEAVSVMVKASEKAQKHLV